MNPDTLASGAILISAWRANARLSVGMTGDDSRRLLETVAPICDFVAKIARRNTDADQSFRALGQVRDDTHAQSVLQRHLEGELRAEAADHAGLLQLLLAAGEVSAHGGFTRIDIPRPDDGRSGQEHGVIVSITIPHPATMPSRLTPPAHRLLGRDVELEKVLGYAESASANVQVIAITALGGGFGATDFARSVADQMYQGRSARMQMEISLGQARAPGDALFDALSALGVPPRDIPATLDQRAACYRAALADATRRAGTRPLVLLDDVRGLHQVEPFLPACPCIILITGEHLDSRLRSDRMAVIPLGPLDEMPSLELLASRLNSGRAAFERTRGNATAPRRLVRLCEGVPLALAIMAGVLESAAEPEYGSDSADTLTALVAELERARYRLESVPVVERPVFAALRVSYDRLSPPQRGVLHALALLDLPRFDLNLIAAASGLGSKAADDTVNHLVSLSLLETIGLAADRWRMHRLVRKFVRDAIPERVMAESERIITEAAKLYLRRARSLAALLGLQAAHSDPSIMAWAQEQLDAQQPALVSLLLAALHQGLGQLAHRLAHSIAELIELGGERTETVPAAESVVTAARQAGDRGLEARAFRILGKHAERHAQHRSAHDLYARADSLSGEASEVAAGEAGTGEELTGKRQPTETAPKPHGDPSPRRRPANSERQGTDGWADPGRPRGEWKGPDRPDDSGDGPDRPDLGGPGGGPDGPDLGGPGGGPDGPDLGGPGGSGYRHGSSSDGGTGGGQRPRGGPAPASGGAGAASSPPCSTPAHTSIAAARGGGEPTKATTFGSPR